MAFIQVSEVVVYTVQIAIPGRDTDEKVSAARARLREIAAAEFGDGVEVGISYRLPHGYSEEE